MLLNLLLTIRYIHVHSGQLHPPFQAFLQLLSEFRTASDERAGPGNEASFLLVNHDLIWFPDHSNGRGEGSEIGNRSRFLKWHVCVLIITCKWRENTACC